MKHRDSRDMMREAVHNILRNIQHPVDLVLFEGDADRHNVCNTRDGDRLVDLLRIAFTGITLSNAKNEVDRKTAFLSDAFHLINRLTGRFITVRLLDVNTDTFCPDITHYPLSISINNEKGKK